MRRVLIFFSILLMALLLPAQEQFRQLYLSGKVVLPDGSAPPEPAIIQLYCTSGRQSQANAKKDGSFNFPVGGSQQRQVTDASRSMPGAPVGAGGSDRSFVSLTDCELRAYLAGYTSSKINLGRRSVFESPDVGTIILTPADPNAGTLVSLKTLAAPKNARKAYEKGQQELSKNKPNAAKAAKELEKAVAEYPEFAAAWNLLGEARVRMQDLDGARTALVSAIEVEPQFVPPYVTLALMELQQNQMAAAAKYADHAVKLQPDMAEASYYRALAHSELGHLDIAEKAVLAVQQSSEAARFPRTHLILGNIFLQRGDVSAAAAEFQNYVALEPGSRAAGAVREQLGKWKAEGQLD